MSLIKINQEKLVEFAAIEANRQRAEAMLTGADYNGYQVSFKKADRDAMLQVEAVFRLGGITYTVIEFANGTKMPMTPEEFQTFAPWFMTESNKFFIE
jgi:hypothetical protein